MSTLTAPAPRPIADIEDDIRRYSARLGLNTVLASSHWINETVAKLTGARAELAAAKGGVR